MKTIEIKADGYTLDPAWAVVGTAGSRGVAQLRFILDSAWEGLSCRVTFFPADGSDAVSIIVTDGIVALPAELTVAAGTAEYVLDGVRDAQTLISLTGKLRVLSTLEPGGEPVSEPTVNDIEQVRSIMQDVLDNIEAAAGKADLVSDAVGGNIAALDAEGNLTDSGIAGSEVLTAHPPVSLTEAVTAPLSPAHGGTFTVVDDIVRDSFGHVTGFGIKTVTLPERRGVSFGSVISRPVTAFGTYTTPGTLTVTVSGKYRITNTDQNSDPIYYEVNYDPLGEEGSIELAAGASEDVYLNASDTLTLSGNFTVTFVCYTAGEGFAVGNRYVNTDSGDVFKCIGTDGNRSFFEYEISLKSPAGSITVTDAEGNFDATNLEAVLSELAESVGNAAESASAAQTSALEALQAVSDVSEAQADCEADCALKANSDGYYPAMAVGTADNLAGKGDGVGASFIYRTTGGTADVADGAATVKSIKGNTLVWNQLMPTTAVGTQTINGVLFKNNGDGSWTVNGTATARTDKQLVGNLGKSGDKMLVVGCPAGGSGSTYLINEANTSVTLDTGEGKIVTRSSYGFIPCITIKEGYTANNLVFRPQVFDLTQMFGAGNEPSSVEEFKALFPNDYYEYDAGSLLSFNATGIKTVGFNAYNGTYTKVVKGEIGGGKNNGYEIVGTYTAIKFSETADGAQETLTVETDGGVSYIVPPSNGYVFIEGASSDTCLHLRWSGIRNGEYEDYWTQTRTLPIATYFPNGMRSAGAVYDELTANKAITRIGSRAYASGDESDATVITDGTNTYFALETPTEVEIASPLNLSYTVSDFGTEEIVSDNTAPCNMDVVYGLNAVDTIRRLPDNYVAITEQSLTAAQKAQILTNLGISETAHIVGVPAAVNSIGIAGNIAYDTDYFYICTSTDTWRRLALSAWN